MRTLVLSVLAIMTMNTSTAGDKSEWRVRMFYDATGDVFHTGDTVSRRRQIVLLFLDEPCSLKIAAASIMHRAWQALGAYQVGCWLPPTGDDYFLIFDGTGDGRGEKDLEIFPRGRLNSDGSVTITEPNYSSNTFMAEVWSKKSSEQIRRLAEHMNEGPVPEQTEPAGSAAQALNGDSPTGWMIQVAVFGSGNNAERLAQRLRSEGYPVIVDQSSIRGTQLYHVRVGPESSRAVAVTLNEKLHAAGYLDTRVVSEP